MQKIHKLSNIEKRWIRENWQRFSTRQLWMQVNANRKVEIGYSTFRTRMYDMGLKKCKIIRWKPEWVTFLKEHYRIMGDVQLARDMNKKFKHKLTKKHVNKKRRGLMGWHRTEEEVIAIKQKNKEAGCLNNAAKRWATTGSAPEGELRVWKVNKRYREFIKVDGKYVCNSRYQYVKHYGPVPDGMKVYHRDCNRLNNEPENLVARQAGSLTREDRKMYKLHDRALAPVTSRTSVAEENIVIRHEDLNGKVRVQITPKLTVFVRPGTDIVKLREKYAQCN